MSEALKNLIEVYEKETAKFDGIMELFRLEQEVYRKIYELKHRRLEA